MSTFKKLFASIAAVMIVVSTAPVAVFGQTSRSAEYQGAYAYAFANGITTMPSIDAANLAGTTTRAQAAKMFVEFAKSLGQTAGSSANCTFSDLAPVAGTDLAAFAVEACSFGLMGINTNGIFNPNGVLSRAEYGTVLSRVLFGDTYNGGNPFYAAHLNALNQAGLMNDLSNPERAIMRGDAFLLLYRASQADLDGLTPGFCSDIETVFACTIDPDGSMGLCPAACLGGTEPTDPDAPVAPGLAQVSLVGSVSTQSVPQDAVAKRIGTIKLAAGANDTVVSSVVIARSGLGNVRGIEGMWLELENGQPATETRRPTTSNQSVTLRFTPALVLKGGSSMNFHVLATLDGGANDQHQFAVTAVNVANGTATGTPVSLGSLTTTSYIVGTVATNLVAGSTLAAGKLQEVIATVDLTPSKSAVINGFTLTRDAGEDFNKAFANVKAFYNSEEVGSVSMTSEKIVVSGLNISRLNGETANLELKADGIYIGATSSVDFSINENDVNAVESQTQERMRNAQDSATLALDAVDLTLTKVSTASQTVAPGSSSVELLNVRLNSAAEFEVSGYELSLVQGPDFTNFVDDRVTVYINGVDYEWEIGLGGSMTLAFSANADRFFVNSSNPVTIRVVGNVRSNATVPEVYQINFEVNTIRNVSNNQTISGLSYNINGDNTTVNQGTYTLTIPSSIPSNKTVMEGTAANVLYFNLRAAAENQVLRAITVEDVAGNDFDTYATKLELMQGNTVLKTINESDLDDDRVKFDGFSRTLTKDVTTPFTVRATLRQGDVQTLGSDVRLRIADASADIDVRRSANQTVDTTTTSGPLLGRLYQIASNIPTVALPEQVGGNTTLRISNGSNYDVVVEEVKFDVTRNIVGNQFAQWGDGGSASIAFLDSIGGASAGTVAGLVPGTTTVTIAGNDLLVGSDFVDRIIELTDAANTVTADLYTVTIREITYHYVDRVDANVSTAITETYNVSK